MLVAQGIDEVVLLDVDAALEGRGPDLEQVSSVSIDCMVPLTVGGGIVSTETAAECLKRGADKVLVTSGALDRPALVSELARRFGSQAVVVGIDVIDETMRPTLYDHRSPARPPQGKWNEWASEAVQRGAGEIRLCVVNREGARSGFALDLYDRIAGEIDVPIVLEGGAGSLAHLDGALAHGIEAFAIGTMLTFSDNNIFKIKEYLAARGHLVRRIGKA